MSADSTFWILAAVFGAEQAWLVLDGNQKHWAIRWSRFCAVGALVLKGLGYFAFDDAMTTAAVVVIGAGQLMLLGGAIEGLRELQRKNKDHGKD